MLYRRWCREQGGEFVVFELDADLWIAVSCVLASACRLVPAMDGFVCAGVNEPAYFDCVSFLPGTEFGPGESSFVLQGVASTVKVKEHGREVKIVGCRSEG